MAVTPFKSSDNFNMAGFNEKITEADNTYVAKTGDSMTGALSMGNNKITDVASPVANSDAATKGYVDGFVKLYEGSYVGNGLYGKDNPVVLNFDFEPYVIFLDTFKVEYEEKAPVTYRIFHLETSLLYSALYTGTVEWKNNNKTVSYYENHDAEYQFNESGKTYHYIALGLNRP